MSLSFGESAESELEERGRVMSYGPVGRFSGNVVAMKARNRKNRLEITHETLACRWSGEQMDYDLAVLGLQSWE